MNLMFHTRLLLEAFKSLKLKTDID